ncbi:nose resistant to fluoxetine protein 6-like [Saccostrea echinata]|uniref:nose resistant to fluoxetine protein 6-like n=1 Tax=Saccostrea echinata TaxID=191078 RepID=UPI002A82D3DD|nr:nose resistant to fluoxetine protein 6-like [Saccostrea echinata]
MKAGRLCVLIFSLISICELGSGNELLYHEYAVNPVGAIQRNFEVKKAIAPFLTSTDFLEWTDHLNTHSLLKLANQFQFNTTNTTQQGGVQNSLSSAIQSLLSGLSNNSAIQTNNGTQNISQLINSLLGSLSLNGNSSQPSNGSQSTSSDNGLGNTIQNILQNPDSIGKFITQMLESIGIGGSLGNASQSNSGSPSNSLVDGLGKNIQNIIQNPDKIGKIISQLTESGGTGVSSGIDGADILKLLTTGNVDPNSAGQMFMLYLNGMMKSSNASLTCQSDLLKVISGLQAREPWALKMLDASAKIPTGVMNLDLNWYGSYDECYSDSTVVGSMGFLPSKQSPVKGHYCTVSLNLPLPPDVKMFLAALQNPGAIRAGMCFPKSCSTDDLFRAVNTFLYAIPLGESRVTAYPITCPTPAEDDTLETSAIVVVVILVIFLLLILVGTLYDVIMMIKSRRKKVAYEKKTEESNGFTSPDSSSKLRAEFGEIQRPKPEEKKSEPGVFGKMMLSFSAYTNGKKILGTSQPKGSLTAINGIRFLSMSWVILGHTLVFILGNTSNTLVYYSDFMGRVSSQVIFNALVSVDTFFVLSGLLTSYLLLKQMSKTKGRINWFLFFFHRFWRLTPVYMMVIGMYVTIYPHLIFGPNKPTPDETCKRAWWKNLLYIDNFFGAKDLCLGWSWYLNNDMQFYVLSPLMIVPLFFNKIAGAVVTFVFLLAATITPGVLSYVKNLPVHTIGGGPKDADRGAFFEDYYIVPYCRMGPYICGVITGYILYKTKCKCRINIFLNLLGWVVATASACAVLYGIYDTVKPVQPVALSKEVAALYNALNRTVWGAAVCWVIFACATGNGGYINTLLSWKAFVPLSRLTYCAYLIHPLVMYVYYLNRNFPFYLTDLDMVYTFLANLMVSYGVAFILSIAFESPFMGLEKVMFGGRGKKEAK